MTHTDSQRTNAACSHAALKVLLVTFSDNADHQDTLFGLYEYLTEYPDKRINAYLLCTNKPRVPLDVDSNVLQVTCPQRPGITRDTFNIAMLTKLIRYVRRMRFDIILFESLHTWNLPLMLFAPKSTTVIHTIHEVIPHEGDKEVSGVERMNRFITKHADYILLHNKTYVDTLHTRYGFPRDRILFLDLFRRYPAYTPPFSGRRSMLFFGRLNPYKGLGHMVELAKALPDILFRVVGKADGQTDKLIGELQQLPNVDVELGYVSDEALKQAFTQARWVLIPYTSASQSGIVVDAYRFSRPVIAFGVGVLKEQVKDQVSGYLLEPEDMGELIATTRRAYEMSDATFECFCKGAYEFGSQKYAVAGQAPKFKELLWRIQKAKVSL